MGKNWLLQICIGKASWCVVVNWGQRKEMSLLSRSIYGCNTWYKSKYLILLVIPLTRWILTPRYHPNYYIKMAGTVRQVQIHVVQGKYTFSQSSICVMPPFALRSSSQKNNPPRTIPRFPCLWLPGTSFGLYAQTIEMHLPPWGVKNPKRNLTAKRHFPFWWECLGIPQFFFTNQCPPEANLGRHLMPLVVTAPQRPLRQNQKLPTKTI